MVDYKKISKALAYALVVSLSFIFAQSYELYRQHVKFQEIVEAKTKPEAQKASLTFIIPLPDDPEPAPEVASVSVPENASLAHKNRNPLNIKSMGKEKWAGQIGTDEFGHAIFSSWEHGLRAAGFTLKAYTRWHGVDTVTGLVKRFCEASDAEQKTYIDFICKRLGVKPDEKIDFVKRMPDLLRAMARYESGFDLPEELFVGYDLLAYL